MAEIVYLVLFHFQAYYILQDKFILTHLLSPLGSVHNNSTEELKNIVSHLQLQEDLVLEPAAGECLPSFTVFI